jgi:hypothetical protein
VVGPPKRFVPKLAQQPIRPGVVQLVAGRPAPPPVYRPENSIPRVLAAPWGNPTLRGAPSVYQPNRTAPQLSAGELLVAQCFPVTLPAPPPVYRPNRALLSTPGPAQQPARVVVQQRARSTSALVIPTEQRGAYRTAAAPVSLPNWQSSRVTLGVVWPPVVGTIQRAKSTALGPLAGDSNIHSDLWKNHQQTLLYGGGDNDTKEVTLTWDEGGLNVEAYASQKNFYHFCNGHLVREFSFKDDNIERSAYSSFWEPGTTVAGVKEHVKSLLEALKSQIRNEIRKKGSSTLTSNNFKLGTYTYTYTIKTDADDDNFDPDKGERGEYTSGTAQLEQFYPVSKDYYADQARLKALRDKLPREAK